MRILGARIEERGSDMGTKALGTGLLPVNPESNLLSKNSLNENNHKKALLKFTFSTTC
jgi:hypothetical protein